MRSLALYESQQRPYGRSVLRERCEPQQQVPFLDLRTAHEELKGPILADVAELIDSNLYVNGPQVAEFEQAFARYCGARHCVGLASGLDALRLALIASEIESGDEVIVPANTFVATLEAVAQAGGRPVLVDAGLSDWNIDVVAADAAVTTKTRYLIPVHLYGQMADMRRLLTLAGRKGLTIVEDACQAHGAQRDGLRAGTGGGAGAFSFYPGKNLGAMGDAGALVTDNGDLADTVRALREHGQRRKYHHELEGYTARLDTIQAIVLLHKLRELDRWTAERRAVAAAYAEALLNMGDLLLLPVPDASAPVWHLFAVRTADPEKLATFLRARGIATGRHYPEPVHLAPAYGWLGYREGTFPVAEALARESLSLPMFPGMTESQVALVAEAVMLFFRGDQ